MADRKEVNVAERYEHQYQEDKIGDVKFLITDSFLSFDNDMPFWRNLIMKSYFNLKSLSVKETVFFGLDESNVTIEKYPVIVTHVEHPSLERQN